MLWQFTAYNGVVWNAPHQMTLIEATQLFMKVNELTEWDIKLVENLH